MRSQNPLLNYILFLGLFLQRSFYLIKVATREEAAQDAIVFKEVFLAVCWR